MPAIAIPEEPLAEFCRRWKITELDLFGSALGSDFGPESDVDLLVTFREGVTYRLRDYLQMEEELREIFGREVDFVERHLVEESPNWIKRRAILDSAIPIYVEG
jgi:predicted nucleotidyltransferase